MANKQHPINWAILRQHQQNYDGTCKYCGGRCEEMKAIIERKRVENIIANNNWDVVPTAKKAQFRRNYRQTLNYTISEWDR